MKTAPSNNQLRFFHAAEAPEARAIAEKLSPYVPNLAITDLSSQYENSTAIRPRHYELWLRKDANP